jgi:multicomponent Na+:H+ antiporter subunit B
MTDLLLAPFQIDFWVTERFLLLICVFLCVICVQIIRSNNLLTLAVLMSFFSLLLGACYLVMDAPDVTMTEVALGSALSSCVILNMIKNTGDQCKKPSIVRIIWAVILCSFFVVILSFVCLELPIFGSIDTPLHSGSASYYISNNAADIGIPSFVAAILASYRGFDTLGETSVILIAGLAVVFITSRIDRKR